MSRRRLAWLIVIVAIGVLSPAVPAEAVVGDGPCSGSTSGDFNGDGRTDLAVGVPDEDIDGAADAGVVNIIYGGAGGLTDAGDQLWYQNAAGMNGASEAGDRFGACLASGNFNGDLNGANPVDDLAIGVPGEDVNGDVNAGAINVIYGSGGLIAGLTTAVADQLLHQDTSGIQGQNETGDAFGGALAAGDFNNDGEDELAVGVPFENVGSIADAGAVNILRGDDATGVTGDQDQLWSQNSTDILDDAEADDKFGGTLAAGDFNGDGRDDLAIGIPEEDIGTVADAGALQVLYGSATFLSAAADQFWSQASTDVADDPEASDFFSGAMAAANFGGDASEDLAIGVPLEDLGANTDAGAVHVLFGSGSGVVATGSQFVTQDAILSTADTSEATDVFGASLAAANFGDGPYSDLAIGAPFENVGATSNAGSVDVVYGGAAGLNLTAAAPTADNWTQDSTDVEGAAEAEDAFGAALTFGNFNGAESADLAIGVPQEETGAAVNTGLVNVIYGTAAGLDPVGPPVDQIWEQGGAILDSLEANDLFGSAAS